jgi:hypothetical protein
MSANVRERTRAYRIKLILPTMGLCLRTCPILGNDNILGDIVDQLGSLVAHMAIACQCLECLFFNLS